MTGISKRNKAYSMIIEKAGTLHEKVGSIEYKMPEAMAKSILKQRRDGDKNMRPQDYLVKYVNEELNLMRHCVKVITY